jgi:hypothetical protein
MKPTSNNRKIALLSGFLLLMSFFLPWVNWKQTSISGYFLPSGRFFAISDTQFNLNNPFPQFNFTFYIFWLIPLLAAFALVLIIRGRRANWPTLISSALSLSLVTVFYLFTKTLSDLGITYSFKPGIILAIISAIAFILSCPPPYKWLKKFTWIIIGPLFAWLSFVAVERTVWNQTFEETEAIKADYSVDAKALLNEFATNDSAANKKYREKIIEVKGMASKVELQKDSTVNIQFADSTGSYIIFPFEKKYFEKLKGRKEGDFLLLKGSCSGSIRSDILGITTISFKRSTINTK